MNRLTIMSVLFLTACAHRSPQLVIPEALTAPVLITCPDGSTSRAVGKCLIALREGLNVANSQLAEIRQLSQTP